MRRAARRDSIPDAQPPDVDAEASARPERPSKSQMKRDMTALQDLGTVLVDQPPERLERLDLDEMLRDAIAEARRIRDHEGRRRQMQYIGRLMRDLDPEPIRAAVEAWAGSSRAEAAALHALERWRDRLLDDDQALTAFASEHTSALDPDALQRLRTAIRMARKERAEARPPRHSRELFRLIRDVVGAGGSAGGIGDER